MNSCELLYLSGPITGCDYKGATGWRQYVASQMPLWIQTVTPMRGKKPYTNSGAIQMEYPEEIIGSERGIYARDRFDVRRCTMMVANVLGTQEVSKGTMVELGWADAWQKPIILIMEEGNIHNHPIVRRTAGFITDSIDEAIKTVVTVLSYNDPMLEQYAHDIEVHGGYRRNR